MMDWNPIPFEPNLKFASELSENLQAKYLDQHEKAKQTLESFSRSLQNVFNEHRKLLADNIELSLTNEKLQQIINNRNEFSQQRISTFIDKPSSEILGASPNCKLESLSKVSSIVKKINSKSYNEGLIEQKENINELVPIFSCDFNSDVEDEAFEKHKSPPTSVKNTPEKVQNSPILSKRKRFCSKKNNSSISNTSAHSIGSSNDSKISSADTPSMLEKYINANDNEYDKEPEKKANKEPLKTIENTFMSIPSSQDKNKGYNILGVSTTSYGRTEFTEKGKKLRQTTLSLKKVVPIIDISKVDSQETLSGKKDSKCKMDGSWNETFFNGSLINQNINTKEEEHKNENLNKLDNKKESCEVKNINATNLSNEKSIVNQDKSINDDELVETSPAHNEKSKLRNKLSLNRKLEIGKIKVKSPSVINSETVSNLKGPQKYQGCVENNNISNATTSKQTKVQNNFNAAAEKRKSFEPQRTFSDVTYFSPAEHATNKNGIADYEMDMTDFEDEMKCETPPAKKILLNSFDIIPGRQEKSPDYAYKEAPVRNKNERAQLPGWGCRDCDKYYGHLPEKERKKRQNQCSRHRGKYKADILTPESFWNPVFDDTNYSSCNDY